MSGYLGSEELKRQLVKLESEKKALVQDRDQALEDLKNVETAFSDLHRKYERAKSTLENLKKNEDTLIQRDNIFVRKIEEKDSQLSKLKQEVQSTLERMYADYEAKRESQEIENTKLRALVRKTEMRISGLESDLEMKARENAQLHNLCDDLINNGPKGKGDT